MSTTPEIENTFSPPAAAGDSTTHSGATSAVNTLSGEQVGPTTPESGTPLDSPTAPVESTTRVDANSVGSITSKKKRGNQGVFQGQYKEYLLQRAPEYLALPGRNERAPWLTGLVADWFAKWPWHLGSEPEEFQVLNSPAAAQSLTPEEIKQLKERRQKVRNEVVKLGQEVSCLIDFLLKLMGGSATPKLVPSSLRKP